MSVSFIFETDHERDVVLHAAITEGIRFDLIAVAAFLAFTRHGCIVRIRELQQIAAGAARTVSRVDSHCFVSLCLRCAMSGRSDIAPPTNDSAG